MYLSKRHISRRAVLKGVGATIALPLLDAMHPAATAWARTAAGSTPTRFAFIGFPHGAIMDPAAGPVAAARHRGGADGGGIDADSVRVHRVSARRDHGPLVAAADRPRLR